MTNTHNIEGFDKLYYGNNKIKAVYYSDNNSNLTQIAEIFQGSTLIDYWLSRFNGVKIDAVPYSYSEDRVNPASLNYSNVKLLKGYYEIIIAGGGGGGYWFCGT